jgi:hypothetical protein
LFNLLLGDIRLPKLKLISEQKAENISVARHIANAMLAAVIHLWTVPSKSQINFSSPHLSVLHEHYYANIFFLGLTLKKFVLSQVKSQ